MKTDAAILLQRLLRGRSQQINMSRGKERRAHLIEELRVRKSLLTANGDDAEGKMKDSVMDVEVRL